MSLNLVSTRIASRPDLVKEFVAIETNVVATLKKGGEVGVLRRAFDDLTDRTMRELGLPTRPRGADYAMAGLTIAARALHQRLPQNSQSEEHRIAETEEVETPRRRAHMSV